MTIQRDIFKKIHFASLTADASRRAYQLISIFSCTSERWYHTSCSRPTCTCVGLAPILFSGSSEKLCISKGQEYRKTHSGRLNKIRIVAFSSYHQPTGALDHRQRCDSFNHRYLTKIPFHCHGNGLHKMSDEEYMSFLNKANETHVQMEGAMDTTNKLRLKHLDDNVEVPSALQDAIKETYYISDADEPFEPVALNIGERRLPDRGEFPNH